MSLIERGLVLLGYQLIRKLNVLLRGVYWKAQKSHFVMLLDGPTISRRRYSAAGTGLIKFHGRDSVLVIDQDRYLSIHHHAQFGASISKLVL